MFWPDVVSLKGFYESPLGSLSAQALRRVLHRAWPVAKDEVILGVGYPQPILASYLKDAQQVMVAMPEAQGVVHWPVAPPNQTFLCDEAQLPLKSNSVNRVVLLHALEHTDTLPAMLEQVSRVLTPAGRVFVVVPNRAGLWARGEENPFASGRPYSSSQLKQILSAHQLSPLAHGHALYLMPSHHPWMLKLAKLFEVLGRSFFPGFGGVMWMEAEKRIYAPERATPVRANAKPQFAPALGAASARR